MIYDLKWETWYWPAICAYEMNDDKSILKQEANDQPFNSWKNKLK